MTELSQGARLAVLATAFGALLFDGFELGLMPVASLSITQDLLGASYTATQGGIWFARFTAALMLGAAVGGIYLGGLGDLIGRTRALGVSVLFYSVFAGLGAYARNPWEMLLLRFAVGLGVGGVWPNAIALANECWPNTSRPVVSGITGAALNAGILLLSQIARIHGVTPDAWKWLFKLAAAPAALGILALLAIPESPLWLASKGKAGAVPPQPIRELFRPPLLRVTLLGILIGSIPMVGSWAASKWMIPWADEVAGKGSPSYKAMTQGCWAFGATVGSFVGAQVAAWLGRRRAYAMISVGATTLTLAMFLATAPLRPSFLPIVLAQGFVSTLFFGWLALYLPELFPTRVRAAGSGTAYNTGRFATAIGVLFAGGLFTLLGGSYPKVGALCGLIYLAGTIAIWWAPDTSRENLNAGREA